MPRKRLSTASDAELLALSTSDPEAFGVFYDRFEGAVLAFFYRATGRADLAADLTGEVFAAALQSASGFRRERGSARAWIFGIARHELADAWERGRVEDTARQRLRLDVVVLTDTALERIEQIAERDGAAMQLLAELPEEQRMAVTGRVLEDRDYDELAASMACSPSVVRQRVSRGLRSLRARMEETR